MNKQADITLVHLQGTAPVVSAPLGCLCLLSALEAAGMRAEFRDYQLGDGPPFDHGDLVRFISDDSAGIIGISAMVNVLPHMVSALREIRMARPDKKIILGGPGPASVAASLLAEYPVADVIVRGEGEVTLPAVMHALAGGRDPAVIPGVVCRSTAGIVQCPGPGRITELDRLPPPAFHRVDFARYNGAVPLELTRGCPFTCAFCETSAFWGREVRHYSPERVARSALVVAERTGRTQFGFVDDTFGLDRDRAERLIDLLAGTGITWTCSTRVERLSESWVGRLAGGGCTGVFLGIESGSDRVLDRIGKRGVPADQIAARVELLKGRFDPVTASFVWGFPFESLHDLTDTLALAASLRGHGAATPLHLLSALPSAPLTREFAGLRRFDPRMMPDLSSIPLDSVTTGLVRENVDVFSSFYYFDHPAIHAKRSLVRRHGRPRASRPERPSRASAEAAG